MTLQERYDEIMDKLGPGVAGALIDELDEGPIEAYILAAAEVLGFNSPGVALDLEMSLDALFDLHVRG